LLFGFVNGPHPLQGLLLLEPQLPQEQILPFPLLPIFLLPHHILCL
jgi:hypothetical protein